MEIKIGNRDNNVLVFSDQQLSGSICRLEVMKEYIKVWHVIRNKYIERNNFHTIQTDFAQRSIYHQMAVAGWSLAMVRTTPSHLFWCSIGTERCQTAPSLLSDRNETAGQYLVNKAGGGMSLCLHRHLKSWTEKRCGLLHRHCTETSQICDFLEWKSAGTWPEHSWCRLLRRFCHHAFQIAAVTATTTSVVLFIIFVTFSL